MYPHGHVSGAGGVGHGAYAAPPGTYGVPPGTLPPPGAYGMPPGYPPPKPSMYPPGAYGSSAAAGGPGSGSPALDMGLSLDPMSSLNQKLQGMGFLNPAAAMVEGSREHVSAGGGGLPPLWRVRLDIPPLSRSAYGDGATVKAAKQEAARALLRLLEGLPPAAGAAAARAVLAGGGPPMPVSMMLPQPGPKPAGGAAPSPPPPPASAFLAGYGGSGAASLASAGASSGDSRTTATLVSGESLGSGAYPLRHGQGAAYNASAAEYLPAGAASGGAGDAGSVASAADSRSASASTFSLHAAPLPPSGAAAAALAAAAHVGDAMCRLNTRLQLMGYQNPAAVLREVSRTHVSDIPEVWRVEMAVVPLSISRVGEASTVKEARKAAAAQLLSHLGEPPPFHERESRAAGGRTLAARDLARADAAYDPYYQYSPGMGGYGPASSSSAAGGGAGYDGGSGYAYGSSGGAPAESSHFTESTSHVYPPMPPHQYDYGAPDDAAAQAAAAAAAAGGFEASPVGYETAAPPAPPLPPGPYPGDGSSSSSSSAAGAAGTGSALSAAVSESGEPAAHEMHVSPEPADTPASASVSSGGGMGAAAPSSGGAAAGAAAAQQPKPSPSSASGAAMHSWQASDDPAAFAPEERSPAAVRMGMGGGRATHSGGGGGSRDSRGGDDGGPEHGDVGAAAAAAGAGGPLSGGLLLLAAVAAAAAAKSAPPPASGASSRTASAAPPPLPLSTAQLHEFADLLRSITSLPPAELAWEARLGEALLSLSIAFATSPHAPTNAIPSAAVREARLLSRLRGLWQQLESADAELALASSLPDDDPSCASVMRALLWRVFGNAGALGPLPQLAPSLFAFVGLPAPAAPR